MKSVETTSSSLEHFELSYLGGETSLLRCFSLDGGNPISDDFTQHDLETYKIRQVQWILDANVQISARQAAFAAIGQAKTESDRLRSLIEALANQEGPVVYQYLRQNEFDVMNMLVRRTESMAMYSGETTVEQDDAHAAAASCLEPR